MFGAFVYILEPYFMLAIYEKYFQALEYSPGNSVLLLVRNTLRKSRWMQVHREEPLVLDSECHGVRQTQHAFIEEGNAGFKFHSLSFQCKGTALSTHKHCHPPSLSSP